jgi:ankyrin repeat protein
MSVRTSPLLMALLLVTACRGGDAPAPKPAATPMTKSSPRSAPKIDMGGGEARVPQPFTLEQRLLEAVRQGDRPAIERAVELGAALTVKDDLARSTVLLATLDAGDLALVRWLHEKGVPLDEPDAGGRSALSFAAERGHLGIVQYLVEHGAAVEQRDMLQRTPLFHAALSDRPEVIGYLIEQRADPNARDQFEDTPLIVACAKGCSAAATMLLQRGADASLKDQEGRTARQRSAPDVAPCLALPE